MSKSTSATYPCYRVRVGLDYLTATATPIRVEVGSCAPDIHPASIQWLISSGAIEACPDHTTTEDADQ